MHKIIITSEYFGKFSNQAKILLQTHGFEVVDNPYYYEPSEFQILEMVEEANGIICDLEKINRNIIDRAKKLKIISRRGVGTDSVDVLYARSKGIVVARTLGVVEIPVADLVLNYILNWARDVKTMNSSMKQGKWDKILGTNLNSLVLGIVGLGAVGKAVAKRASSFGKLLSLN